MRGAYHGVLSVVKLLLALCIDMFACNLDSRSDLHEHGEITLRLAPVVEVAHSQFGVYHERLTGIATTQQRGNRK